MSEKAKTAVEVDFAIATLSDELVDVPLGLFLDCVHLLQDTAENYRVPVELVKAMRMALYKTGNYNAEMIAGELYRLIEWKEKSDGNS